MYRATILLFLFAMISSCDDEIGGVVVSNADVNLIISAKYNGQTFLVGRDYIFGSKTLNFSKCNLYLSNHALFIRNTNPESKENTVLDEIEHLDFGIFEGEAASNAGFNVNIGKAPTNTLYDGLAFSLGVPADLNRTQPSEYGGNHPLSKTELYLEEVQSYIFFQLEGMVDQNSDGTFDDDFVFNLILDDSFRELSISHPFEVFEDQSNILRFELDLLTLFDNGLSTIDFNQQLTTSTTEYDDIMRILKSNFSAALDVQ